MNTNQLNSRYGAPGRIVFRTGHCGYPEVALANKYGVAEVALLGANVLSYRPTGHAPVVFRPERRDYNRSESIHGGIPVCWPQFGRLAIPGMSTHGFARIMPFGVRGSTYSDEMTEIVLGLSSDDATRSLWPHDFDLEVTVSVSMKLNLKLTTKNVGSSPFEFSAGFHPYLLVGNRDECRVRGLDGEKYVYAEDMSEHVQLGDLAMTSSTDHVFALKPALKHEFALVDDRLRRAIAVVASGNGSAVVWNPGPEGRFPDLCPDDWRRFVCVEPVSSWPGTVSLGPGESHELMVAIQSAADGCDGAEG